MSAPAACSDNLLVDELAEWLMSRALADTTPEQLVAGCCERLVAADIPLWCVQLGFRTLHPLFQSVSLTWRAGQPLEVGVPLVLSSQHAALIDEPVASLGRHRLPGVGREQEVFTLRELDEGGGAGEG